MSVPAIDGSPTLSDSEIAALVGQDLDGLWAFVRQIPSKGYRTFAIAGNGKRRVIASPNPTLKSIQTQLYERVLLRLPISARVFSRRGRDVVENARQHLNRDHMVVLDIQDCFPSTTHCMVRSALQRVGFSESTSRLLTRLTTFKGVLPQGPPTSPAILNVVMNPLDDRLTALAEEYDSTYTRYFDDLCFSADVPLTPLAKRASKILKEGGYKVNRRKRRVWGPGDRHTVTKIVVSSTLNPDPEYLIALVKEIRNLEEGQGNFSIAELLGKAAWVKRLNPQLGKELMRWLGAYQRGIHLGRKKTRRREMIGLRRRKGVSVA